MNLNILQSQMASLFKKALEYESWGQNSEAIVSYNKIIRQIDQQLYDFKLTKDQEDLIAKLRLALDMRSEVIEAMTYNTIADISNTKVNYAEIDKVWSKCIKQSDMHLLLPIFANLSQTNVTVFPINIDKMYESHICAVRLKDDGYKGLHIAESDGNIPTHIPTQEGEVKKKKKLTAREQLLRKQGQGESVDPSPSAQQNVDLGRDAHERFKADLFVDSSGLYDSVVVNAQPRGDNVTALHNLTQVRRFDGPRGLPVLNTETDAATPRSCGATPLSRVGSLYVYDPSNTPRHQDTGTDDSLPVMTPYSSKHSSLPFATTPRKTATQDYIGNDTALAPNQTMNVSFSQMVATPRSTVSAANTDPHNVDSNGKVYNPKTGFIIPKPYLPKPLSAINVVVNNIDVRSDDTFVMPRITMYIVDDHNCVVKQKQDTCMNFTRQNSKLHFDAEMWLQQPLQNIGADYGVIFELKHYKAKGEYVSTKCWAFMDSTEIATAITRGHVNIELYQKPVDLSRKKLKLFGSKPMFLNLSMKHS